MNKRYIDIYNKIFGTSNKVSLLHVDYSASHALSQTIAKELTTLRGKTLDVGCADAPYKDLLHPDVEYVGLDISPGSSVDILIAPGLVWPVEAAVFDNVLVLQVLEHVEDLNFVLSEIYRVLKPGGSLLVSIPFLYNEHGSPDDFRRLTLVGLRSVLSQYSINREYKVGGVGSTIALLLNNFCIKALLSSKWLLPLVPFFFIATVVNNVVGFLMDKIDNTHLFYNNVIIVCQKK